MAKVTSKTKARWSASETARGIKVRLVIVGEHVNTHDLGNELFFNTVEDVKRHCKGEIVFTKRKVVTSKSTVISK